MNLVEIASPRYQVLIEGGDAPSTVEIGIRTQVLIEAFVPGPQGAQGIQGPPGQDAQEPPKGPAFTYSSGILTRIDYDDSSFKVFSYSSGKLSQIDFTRSGTTTRKTFNYTGDVLTSIDETTL